MVISLVWFLELIQTLCLLLLLLKKLLSLLEDEEEDERKRALAVAFAEEERWNLLSW